MYLSKHKSGIFYIYYTKANGRRTKVSTKTKIKRIAFQFFKNFNEEKSNTFDYEKRLCLKDFMWKFLLYSENYHTWKTTLTYKTTFNFLVNFLGNKRLEEIRSIEIDEFIQNRIRNISLHAGRKDLINIKSAFNWAVQMNLMQFNPAKEIRRIKSPEKLPLFFTSEEYQKLLAVIDNSQIKNIVEIAVNTGMRQMEILSLRWNQVNLIDKYVILNNHNHITKAKRIRNIPLNSKCVKIFETLRMKMENENIFIFNGEQMKQDYLVKNFKRYVLKAKINPKLNFHSLRHTFASWLVQRGVSIYQVSKLLGHADIKTTEIYAHLRAEDLRKSVDMLN